MQSTLYLYLVILSMGLFADTLTFMHFDHTLKSFNDHGVVRFFHLPADNQHTRTANKIYDATINYEYKQSLYIIGNESR